MMQLKEYGFDPYYEVYTKLSSQTDDVLQQLLTQHMDTVDLVTSLDDQTLYTPYAAGKWSIMEILVHLMDTERIFCYRALSIARGDQTQLPGYNQDDYVLKSEANGRKILDVVKELSVLRSSTIALFSGLTQPMLQRSGYADGKRISAGAVPYVLLGHEMHHLNVIEQKYIGKY